MGDPLRVGIVGLGTISGQYLDTLGRLPSVEVVATADQDPARAAMTPADLYASDEVDLVLNLTPPAAHASVALAAIAAGKHIYGEKPLATSTVEGRAVLDAASAAGVRVGCAPDTVLGTGVQTARQVIDDGSLGTPVAATAFMVTPGHERWHPAPEFYYQPGGGPLLDMGPYYLSALVTLLGPVRRVTGMTSTPRPTRTTTRGVVFPVSVATHVTGTLEHTTGALTTLMMSFDVWAATLPRIEVYGTEGSLTVPDPNGFTGPVRLHRADAPQWTEVPERAGYRDAGRGCGVADLAAALTTDTPHRADGDLAYHVLDTMESLLEAATRGTTVEVTSTCDRPSPVPLT